jgi:hypothetical protein
MDEQVGDDARDAIRQIIVAVGPWSIRSRRLDSSDAQGADLGDQARDRQLDPTRVRDGRRRHSRGLRLPADT